MTASPGGAKENDTGTLAATIPGVRLAFRCLVLSPRWGSPRGNFVDPRLTPWAMILRRYAAGMAEMVLGECLWRQRPRFRDEP